MTYERLQRILIWLLIAAVSVFLVDRLISAVATLASPLLLFALAWLFVLALKPLVDGLARVELPVPVFVHHRPTNRTHITVPIVHIPYSAAVLLVYLGLLTVIIGTFVLLVPVIVPQVAGLQETLPQAANEIVLFVDGVQQYINRLGLRIDLTAILRPEAVSAQVASLGSEVVKQSFNIAGSIASLLFNLVFILIVSFYMMLDGARLVEQALSLLPGGWRSEVETFLAIVDRTFGGFLRAQLLQSLLYGIATAVVMVALGLQDVALASLIAGLMVLIPIIGGFLAMVPPVLIAIIVAPDRVLWLVGGLLLVQQVIFNVVMPRLLGQIVGLPPLLVFAALLVGGTLAGAWGILFGIPIAGVVASVLQFLYDRSAARRAPPVIATPSLEPEHPPEVITTKS